MGDVEGKPGLWRRVEGAHRTTHKENVNLKPLAWKMRGAEFGEFLQPEGPKASSFKGQWAWLG